MLSKREHFMEVPEPSSPKERSYTFSMVSDDLLIQELLKRGYKLEVAT
jgi:hypothetical protein